MFASSHRPPSRRASSPAFSNLSFAKGEFLRVVPDLVVEILSPSTASHDRGKNRVIYARSGVREYWLVDSHAREIIVFTQRGGRFDARHAYAEGAVLRSEVLTELEIDVRSILSQSS